MARGRVRLLRARRREVVRRRRSPEQAREEILDAAERVYADLQPDLAGLKDIAREAGVSHALVTHYFGTYAGLVEAALERRIRALRETVLGQLREGGMQRPAQMLAILFRALADPIHLRLTRWIMASERPGSVTAFALRDQGLKRIAHLVATTIDPDAPAAAIVQVENALLVAVSAAYGFAIGQDALAASVGRQSNNQLDADVQRTLVAMLEGHLREVLGKPLPR